MNQLQENFSALLKSVERELIKHPFALLFFCGLAFYVCRGAVGQELFYDSFAKLWYWGLVGVSMLAYLLLVHATEKYCWNFLVIYGVLVFGSYLALPFWPAISYSFLVEQPTLLLLFGLFWGTRYYGKNFFVECSFLIILMYFLAPFLIYGFDSMFSSSGYEKLDLKFDQERLYAWVAIFLHAVAAVWGLADIRLHYKNPETLQRTLSVYIMFLLSAFVAVPLTVGIQHFLR